MGAYVKQNTTLFIRLHRAARRTIPDSQWDKIRPGLVFFFTNARTTTSKQMTVDEMLALVKYLEQL